MKFQTIVAASVLSCLLGLANAQGASDASATKLDQVRTLYTDYMKVRDEMTALMKDAGALKRGSDEQKAMQAKMAEVRGRLSGPQKAFSEAFLACDWVKFDPKGDAALLKDGLPGPRAISTIRPRRSPPASSS